ncbi:MAG: TetR family transcriptional regulator [Chromatiales bacterium]|nr:TetR family transcriptional regulator [Chromatiales bacterium]
MEAEQPDRSARDRVLDAAIRIVGESGAGRLTLEAVAEAAGISKGGLLYHFRSKEALLLGLLERHLAGFRERYTAELERRGGGQNARVQAYIQSVLAGDTLGLDHDGSLSLLAAVANDPALLVEVRRQVQDFYQEIGLTHPEPLRATRLMLAAEGLMLMDIFGISVLEPAQRQKLHEELLAEAGVLGGE